MVAGAASLVLQLLLTGRLLRVFGVGVALFIVPVAMASASLGVILFGTLVAASALKASDQVLRYSIDKATVELLYLPLLGGRDLPGEVVHRHGGLPPGRRARRPRGARLRRMAGLEPDAGRVGDAGRGRGLDGRGGRGANPLRDQPAGEHPPAPGRGGARLRADPRPQRHAGSGRPAPAAAPTRSSTRSACSNHANVVHPAVPGLLAPRVAGGAHARGRAAVERQRDVGAPRGGEAAARPEPRGADRSAALHDAARQRRPADAHRAARRLPGLLDPRRRWSRSWPGPAAPRTSRRRS